jgi:hypothetical protein
MIDNTFTVGSAIHVGAEAMQQTFPSELSFLESVRTTATEQDKVYGDALMDMQPLLFCAECKSISAEGYLLGLGNM